MRGHDALQRRRSSVSLPRQGRGTDSVALSVLLRRWQDDGIITPEQAAVMATSTGGAVSLDTGEPTVVPRRGSLVVEALGYLGGAIVVAAAMLIAGWYWEDLATGWRLTLVGGATMALLGAGAVVPQDGDEAGERLRAVLWFGSTGACAGFLAVLAVDALHLDGEDAFLLIASGTAAYAFVPWFASRAMLQQAALMVSLAVAAAAAVNELDVTADTPGLGAWGVGVVWALLGWGGIVAHSPLALVYGSATAIIGAMFTAGSDAGTVLTLVTVVAVVGAAMALRDLLLLGVGTLGLLFNVPSAITRWFPDTLAAAYGLLVMGLALVLVAIWIARRRTPQTAAGPRDDESPAHAALALGACGVVVLGVVVTVLTVALV